MLISNTKKKRLERMVKLKFLDKLLTPLQEAFYAVDNAYVYAINLENRDLIREEGYRIMSDQIFKLINYIQIERVAFVLSHLPSN